MVTRAIEMAGPDPIPTAGRPTVIDAVVRTDDAGQPVTASQHVLGRLGEGLSLHDATLGAAIYRGTVDHWCRNGATARIRQAQGLDITENEQKYLAFLADYERVQSDIERARLAKIIQVADGGYSRSRIVRKRVRNEEGEMVVAEETVTMETAEPNWQANAWVLERRFPARYRRRMDVEFSVGYDESGEDPDDQARELAASLRAYQQGLSDAKASAIETSAVDVT